MNAQNFYLASGLDNIEAAQFVRDALVRLGHRQTYDWTVHGPVWRHGVERIREVCLLELKGVADADFVVVVLRGGRGTHTEMGYALALDKPVFIYAQDLDLFGAHESTCAFYHHPNVRTVSGHPMDLVEAIRVHFSTVEPQP